MHIDFAHYHILYETWWRYEESDKSVNFGDMCAGNGAEFEEIKAFYYRR